MKKKIDIKIRKILKESKNNFVFSGCSVGYFFYDGDNFQESAVYYGEKGVKKDVQEVDKTTLFDVASLTKPLVTVLALLALHKEKKIFFEETLEDFFPDNLSKNKSKITVKQLLNHYSGYPAHREYFKILDKVSKDKKRDKIIELLLREKLENKPGFKYEYSDLDYMLLGILIEMRSGQNLGDYFQKKISEPLKISDKIKIFGDINNGDKESAVVTGTCPWSEQTLQGSVHDDNCRAFGRMMGHAGLFATLEGILSLCKIILLTTLKNAEHPFLRTSDLDYLLKPREIKRWAYGFDIPTGLNPSCGKYFSPRTIGHLGYTGTSFWIDLVQKVIVVVLTNRVIYDKDFFKIRKFRPLLHNEILKMLR